MDELSLPRWYHGPLGNQRKEIHPQMSPKTAAEWQKAEREKPKEEEKKQ
jgi:hypothetical protein